MMSDKKKKCYIAGVDEWIVGYVFAETRGKAKTIAWRCANDMVDVDFVDVSVRRAKLLDNHWQAFRINTYPLFDATLFDKITDRILRRLGLAKYDKTERHYVYSSVVL